MHESSLLGQQREKTVGGPAHCWIMFKAWRELCICREDIETLVYVNPWHISFFQALSPIWMKKDQYFFFTHWNGLDVPSLDLPLVFLQIITVYL